jgi:hypothetical protein
MARYVLCGIALAVSMMGATDADAKNLRDGCPAGRLRGYTHTHANRMGALPLVDSFVGLNRVSLAGTGAYLTSTPNDGRDSVHSGKLVVVRGIGDTIGLVTASLPVFRGSVTDSADGTREVYSGVGNMSLGAALRWHYLSSLDGSVLRVNSDDKVIGGLRKATGIGLIGSFRINDELDPLVQTSDRFTFDRSDFTTSELWGPISSAGVRGEHRLEIVGCYAPFVHISTSPVLQRTPAAAEMLPDGADIGHWKVTLPFTAAVGIEVGQRTSAYLEYGVAVRWQSDEERANRVRFLTSHRIRVGLEYRHTSAWWLGLTFDGYLGSQDGIFVTANLTRAWGAE